MSHHQRLEQLFSTNGDGTGFTDMSRIAAEYTITPPENFTYKVYRVTLYMEDDSKFAAELYGGISALDNGIVVTTENPSGVITTHTPQPIKTTGQWSLLGGVDIVWTDFIAGNDWAILRWTFARYGPPISLSGDDGEFLKINVQDTLAGLVSHIAQAQGEIFWTG